MCVRVVVVLRHGDMIQHLSCNYAGCSCYYEMRSVKKCCRNRRREHVVRAHLIF